MRKLWHLSSAERGLLLKAGILLTIYRIALWVLPWNRVSVSRPSPSESSADRPSVERLEWAVRTARRMVPFASCLTQALALNHLLARAGYESSIHIGVAKTEGRGFEAHAWVEHVGVTLLSSPSEVAHYSRLLALRAPSL
ncbi:lasso peptide biosynthesis B2 protein [Candidatus Binatus sp.]|uniref:lasso peptide biosynthesis B2 protein n=1 Tax=Candidatus Binatus sp. TaxID=2811406 RepID=UPI003CC69506